METKLFEIRDAATCIPAFGVLLTPKATQTRGQYEAEAFLLRRAGFALEEPHVMLVRLDGGAEYDPYKWPRRSRTMHEAHRWISDNWYSLESGDVVDVEFILGETEVAKLSERENA